jgi:hypothetical protein
MAASDKTTPARFLARWSARKRAALRDVQAAPAAAASAPVAVPRDAGQGATVSPSAEPPDALPPVDSLTLASDFAPFMQPTVDDSLKRAALRKLFTDPHFNIMDGLDVYIDDYSKPDPISPDIVAQLMQGRYIFNPPETRVNEQGVVEDVPAIEPPAEPEGTARLPAADTAAGSTEMSASSDTVAVRVPEAQPVQAELPLPEPSQSQ